MDTTDINNLTVKDDFIITDDTSAPELYESTGKKGLDHYLLDQLSIVMYSFGLDDFLLKKGAFSAQEYKDYLTIYHIKHRNKKLSYDRSIKEKSYDYFKRELEKNSIFYKDKNGKIYRIDESIFDAISRIVNNSVQIIDEDNYNELMEFINYIDKDMSRGGR